MVQLTVEVRDQYGQPVAGAAVTWASSGVGVAATITAAAGPVARGRESSTGNTIPSMPLGR